MYLLALIVQLASAKETEYRLDFQLCLSIWFCERAYASPVVCPRIHLAECLRGRLPQTSHYDFFLFYFLFHDLLIGHSLVEFIVGHLTGPFVFEKDGFTRCRPALQEVEEMGVKQMAGGEGGGTSRMWRWTFRRFSFSVGSSLSIYVNYLIQTASRQPV